MTLFQNWVRQATVTTSPAAWAVTVLVEAVLLVPALLMYFHALKWRTVAVFMLSGAVIIDWQVQISLVEVRICSSCANEPVSALPLSLLSSTAVQLIIGIITAVTCFGFIGLQFSRMQLSRNGLSVLVASLENVINKQKVALRDEQQSSSYLRMQTDELVRIIEAINIVRPIPKEYAWALASCSNVSTFMQLHEQAPGQLSPQPALMRSLPPTDSPIRSSISPARPTTEQCAHHCKQG